MQTIIGKSAATSVPRGPSVALFVDIDNTNMSKDNLTEIISILRPKGSLVFGKVYGYGDDKVNQFEELITEYRLDTVGKMRFKGSEASVVDTRLVVDCLHLTEEHRFASVFVWAGRGDMISLFSKLKELGTRVLTIDNPLFDCDNKFVDEKIHLFSPYSLGSPKPLTAPKPMPAPAARPVPPPTPTETAPLTLDGKPVPALPRKKGAPEFNAPTAPVSAAAESESEIEIGEMAAEDNEELLNRLIGLYGQYVEEMDEKKPEETKPKPDDDLGDLKGVVKTEDDYFAVNPTPTRPIIPNIPAPGIPVKPATAPAVGASGRPILHPAPRPGEASPTAPGLPRLKPLPALPKPAPIGAAVSSPAMSTPPPSPFIAAPSENKSIDSYTNEVENEHVVKEKSTESESPSPFTAFDGETNK